MKCPKCGAEIDEERIDAFIERMNTEDWNRMLEEVRLMAFANELIEAFKEKNMGVMVTTLRKIFKEKEEFTYPEWIMEELYKKDKEKGVKKNEKSKEE